MNIRSTSPIIHHTSITHHAHTYAYTPAGKLKSQDKGTNDNIISTASTQTQSLDELMALIEGTGGDSDDAMKGSGGGASGNRSAQATATGIKKKKKKKKKRT